MPILKKFVINLDRRPDRRQFFLEKNPFEVEFFSAVDVLDLDEGYLKRNGYGPDLSFKDPFKGRYVTWAEVACFLSHSALWAKCLELNEPLIVLEDDAYLIGDLDERRILSVMSNCDLLYLQRNENEPTKVVDLGNGVERPHYPYNTTAYCVTPSGAEKLLATNILRNIIPVDEYLPRRIQAGSLVGAAFSSDIFNQAPKTLLGSDIENNQKRCLPFLTSVFTVGTDTDKCGALFASAAHFGVAITNLGKGKIWKGGDMNGPGGGMKVRLLQESIANLDEDSLILFVDAYDVFFTDGLDEIINRYLEMEVDILFAAEAFCWPDESLAGQFPQVDAGYRFLNSGLFIGRCGALRRLLDSASVADDDDDQLFYQTAFLSGEHDVRLDTEAYIFQCHDVSVTKRGKQIFNPTTRCFSCVYHGNGGDEAKRKFQQMYGAFFASPFAPTLLIESTVEQVGVDMLLVDFLTPSQCAALIRAAEFHGSWAPMDGDKFPAQEIRLMELDLFYDLERLWEDNVVPIVERFWSPVEMYGLRDAFVTRYTVDTQARLSLHTDASLLTGSLKLNDGYTGGLLNFPRQGWSNVDIPVGRCLLFPGQLTHGHESTTLESGVKYSLTIWTSRFPGDKL
jgi:hypothetical protein